MNEYKECDLGMDMLSKDIDVALLAFKSDDFQLLNVIGNRIMSDCLLMDLNRYILLGFFIKQMAIIYIPLKPRLTDKDYTKAKICGDEYLNTYVNITEKSVDKDAWHAYHKFHLEIHQIIKSDMDKKIKEVYGDRPEITRSVCQKLMTFVSENRSRLNDPNSVLIDSIVVDFQRVGLSYGYNIIDTIIFTLLVALQRFWEYFKIDCTLPDGQINSKAVSNIMYPFIDRIIEISYSKEIDYEKVSTLFFAILGRWRSLFFIYSEVIGRAEKLPGKPIELDNDTKKKLSEVVSKALQKEVNT